MQSVAGSPGYYAPEVMLGSTVGYTKKVDIWRYHREGCAELLCAVTRTLVSEREW